MNRNSSIAHLAAELLNLTTAPFREEAVRRYIKDFCASRNLSISEDTMGNIIVSLGNKSAPVTLAFVAHMDHPGFIVEKDSLHGETTALFYGGVEEPYLRTANVRVFGTKSQVIARVTKTEADPPNRVQRVYLKTQEPIRRGDIGMWDLPAFEIRRGRIYSRACDDLIGCAAILALLDQLSAGLREASKPSIPCRLLAVFTTAEEAGLHGAKYLCMKRKIPKDASVISIEASSARGRARMGGGAIVRVGDSRSIFDPGLTSFITHVAHQLLNQENSFQFQRKLMDGGRCEASIFQEFGYRASGICVPLGNYHNRNFSAGKIESEYISVSDLESMVRLFRGLVDNVDRLPEFICPKPPRLKEEIRALGERIFQ